MFRISNKWVESSCQTCACLSAGTGHTPKDWGIHSLGGELQGPVHVLGAGEQMSTPVYLGFKAVMWLVMVLPGYQGFGRRGEVRWGGGGAYGGVILAGALGVVVVGEYGVAADPLAPHRLGCAALRRLRRRRHRRCHLPESPSPALEKSRKISLPLEPTEGIKQGAPGTGRAGRPPENGSESNVRLYEPRVKTDSRRIRIHYT